MGAYKEGERVRVVLEGEVHSTVKTSDNFTVGFNRIRPDDEHVVSVEKVEPPVVTFKPGDVVRHKVGGDVYTIAPSGYINHRSGCYWTTDSIDDYFNSRLGYVKVELK